MKNRQRLEKKLQITFVCAQPYTVLNKLISAGIHIQDVAYCDPLTVRMWIFARDFEQLKLYMQNCDCSYSITAKRGLLWYQNALFMRPILACGLVIYILTALWLPGRILFVSVEGNQVIPEKYILECAKRCGIKLGSTRKAVRSEQTKNMLLSAIPQLQWVGINTSGCIANITVAEGVAPDILPADQSVSAIIASRDGIVQSINVLHGTGLCTVGQSVKQGEVLISGYTDCGLKITAQNADGEVFAYTNRELKVLAPKPITQKSAVIDKCSSYYLKVGKKVINLYNGSGISGASCDKMYVEEYWCLPGGFSLPISLIRETCVYYDTLDPTWDVTQQEPWVAEFADKYLTGHMVAGCILTRNTSWQTEDTHMVMTGQFTCLEMIGKVKYEETLQKNAEDN